MCMCVMVKFQTFGCTVNTINMATMRNWEAKVLLPLLHPLKSQWLKPVYITYHLAHAEYLRISHMSLRVRQIIPWTVTTH
jgi:hypothetical protein